MKDINKKRYIESKQQNQFRKAQVSLIILTYNEEVNIEHCLKSTCDWVGEIIIVDSSGDKVKSCESSMSHVCDNEDKGLQDSVRL